MMRRFKPSKYKNAAPKVMKHEPWIRDLTVGSYNCCGSFIKASAAFAAFNVQPTGSQLGVVALDAEGSVTGTNLSILNAHSDLVTDFDFSPFEDGLLATCSADSTVKIWSITAKNLDDLSLLSPECATSSKQRRVETVAFHPTAEFLLTYTSQNSLTLWDIFQNKELFHDAEMHGDKIMSVSWCKSGSLLATCAKDKYVRVIDPRAKEVASTAVSHQNSKDSRVLWLGETPYILTSGFDSSRMRQIFVRDTRNFDSPIKTLDFDSSTGILLPLFDPDTSMVFVAGRGDSSISYFEFNSESDDFLLEGYRYNGEQTKGACLVPKRALKVMETEVNRILQLTANSVISIPYYVPRKSYIDFHSDLFPDTCGTTTSGTAAGWMDGHTGHVYKMSLNPAMYQSSKVGGGEAPNQTKSNGTLKLFKPPFAIRKAEEQASIHKVIDGDTSDAYKKAVPEARPRKKSTSSNSSSSEEVGDVVTRFFPVPKPRVSTTTATSTLRTPSQFISRMAADFSHRSQSVDDSEIINGSNSLPLFSTNSNETITHNMNNGNVHAINNNNQDIQEPVSLPETTSIPENGFHRDQLENGNETTESVDGQQVSTSDRRKLFERSQSVQESGSATIVTANGTSNPQTGKKTRTTVAERLKMFQQNATNGIMSEDDGAKGDVVVEKEIEPKKESNSLSTNLSTNMKDGRSDRDFCPAPIAKPERKFTPPKQDPVKVKELPQPQSTQPKAPSHKRIDTVFGQVSKYRNFKAAPFHKKLHIENLRNVSTTCPGESELIQANPARIAIPLNTPGGKVAIFELSRPGRQPDGVIPALVHGSKVMDFMWDPFDNNRLAVGCDGGKLWVWRVPENGLKEQTNEPEFTIAAHAEKIYFVKFHPLAKDILATGSYDLSIRIWDLCSQEGVFLIPCHDQIQIFSFCWSSCGAKFSTAAKDGKIRIYEPRASVEPLIEGKGPAGVRGGRVCWALDGRFLIVSGFDRSSERQVYMYNSKDLSKVSTQSLDVSPAILVPFYDEDSSILFLSGRGDSTIFAFDVIEDSPYLRQLSSHRFPGAHQGMSFLKKNALEVQNVEFARAYRLTEVVVEPWSFTVPRVKSEYFQDDLFPPTKVLWEPTMSAEEWRSGMDIGPPRVSLKPDSMKSLGEINSGAAFHRDKESATGDSVSSGGGKRSVKKTPPASLRITDDLDDDVKKQQEKLEQAIKSKLQVNMKLEQDSMEGVDEEEWNE